MTTCFAGSLYEFQLRVHKHKPMEQWLDRVKVQKTNIIETYLMKADRLGPTGGLKCQHTHLDFELVL